MFYVLCLLLLPKEYPLWDNKVIVDWIVWYNYMNSQHLNAKTKDVFHCFV